MKKILKVIVFFLILFLLLIIASYIVRPKNNGTLSPDKHIDNASGPLAEKENSIDALVIGDSESFAAISPLEIYKDYGYTMYVSGTSGQYLYDSYNYFLKTLTKQKLKVLILETDAIYRKIPISYNFRFWIGEFIPVFHYHNRWKQMTMQDFKMEMTYNYTDTFKGYDFSLNINPATNHNYMEYTEETEKIDKINKYYLDLIKKKCDENDISFILVSTPSTVNWNYRRHNGIKHYARQNKIKYLDLNIDNKAMIDWSKDTRDMGDHLNYYGAYKVSAYLGNYLSKLDILKDHRGDDYYSSWDSALKPYQDEVKKANQD